MTVDLDPTRCPIDQEPLLECTDVDDRGVTVWFECLAGQHHYRAEWGGITYMPDFSEVEAA